MIEHLMYQLNLTRQEGRCLVENFFDDTFSQHSSNSKITKPKKDAKNKEDEASDKKKLKILKEAL